MYQIIKKFLLRKLRRHTSSAEDLRIEFKARYHTFKLLLNSNNKALEIMSGIEQALRERQPFGMPFVRANCTAVSVEVFRMIRNLDELTPGRYDELYARFNDIQHIVDGLLTQKRLVRDERFVIPLSSINKDMADLVGSKMANLGEIKNRIDVAICHNVGCLSTVYRTQ